MINILIPLAGKSTFFEVNEISFPKPIYEINGKTMIELVIENLSQIKDEKRFIFILKEDDCRRFHIDNVVRLLTNSNCVIKYALDETKGAVCTCLLAIEDIQNDDPLIISNGDQIIDDCILDALTYFNEKNYDGGVITFASVHPKWSYVRLNNEGMVIETAEKIPISKSAIAGFYYFKNGKYFIDAAFKAIEKDANTDGLFYISQVFNELILDNFVIGHYNINSNKYHSFYSPKKIDEFESKQ